VVDYMRNLLLVRMGSADQVDAAPELRMRMEKQGRDFAQDDLLETIRLFNTAASEIRSGWQPGLLLELALVEAIEEKFENTPVQSGVSAGVALRGNPPPLLQVVTTPVEVPGIKSPGESQVKSTSSPVVEIPVEKTSTPKVQATQTPSTSNVTPKNAVTSSGLQEILQNWNRIRAMVKKHRSQTEGLLNSCKPLGIKDGVLVLGFASEVLKNKMETPENIDLTRKVIAQVVGVELPIVCMVMNNKINLSPLDADVDGEGMVSAALNLGGQIVHKEEGHSS
jgi:DNA polymerase III subunit gamma/tau